MTTVTLSSAAALILRVRVFDDLTGRGLPDVAPSLELRQGRGIFKPFPASLTRKGHGWFALVAPMDQVLAAIQPEIVTRFRLSAAPVGHDAGEVVLMADRNRMLLIEDVVQAGGGETTLRRFRGAPFDMQLGLLPAAMRLEGIVLADGDPARPESDARVFVDGAQVAMSGADGRFSVDALPQSARVEIAVRKAARETIIAHVIDYPARPNRLTIALPGA